MNAPNGLIDTNTAAAVETTSDAERSVENPFMTLVDAAASLLDGNQSRPTEEDSSSLPPRKNEEELNKLPHSESSVLEDNEGGRSNKGGVDPYKGSNVIPGRSEDLLGDPSSKMTFAEQLMSVLEDESNADVIAWMPDGKSFTIVDHKKFTLDRMPKLFKIRNMSSFVRKLTRWGFHRVHERETRNSDIFKHENFRRGDKTLCKKVKCVGRTAPPPSVPAVPAVIPATQTVASSPQKRSRQLHSPRAVEVIGNRLDFVSTPPGASCSNNHNHHQQHHHHHNHYHHRCLSSGPGTRIVGPRPVTLERTSSRTATVSVPPRSSPVSAHFYTPQPAATLPLPRRVTMDGPTPLSPTPRITSRVVSAALETLRCDDVPCGMVAPAPPPPPPPFADIGALPRNNRTDASISRAASMRALLRRQESLFRQESKRHRQRACYDQMLLAPPSMLHRSASHGATVSPPSPPSPPAAAALLPRQSSAGAVALPPYSPSRSAAATVSPQRWASPPPSVAGGGQSRHFSGYMR